jgi:transcription-repair coupling factor (superfamily II helicase)
MRVGVRSGKQKQRGTPVRFAELNSGDIVVHRDHGLGIYNGLTTVEFQSVINDFMLIEYRDGDRLYLPVDRLNLISKYEGLSDKKPRIDKLGSQSWKTTKSKIKKEVWKVAQELLNIYAQREIRNGRQFSRPGQLFHELEESFPFEETAGQKKAILDVLDDLTSANPMDRLVCGDVGYGKTEVAVRAAFKVVEDGFQTAILVPTTVLAEQHLTTFRERFKGFPVNIECINRFRSPAEQRKILKDLSTGTIDIIIGTHRLLSKDISFHNLGLLIVDEEHRFGVAHKEKVKKMRAEIDILTLTATPIPRTLQMSLLSIRDLSVISSPPEHRRPVKTFVARFDDLVIKEAVSKEIRRNGQVFFVHNRVKSIHKMAATIQRLVPSARVAVAHGQMGGKELEEIMVSFVNKRIDVLVSTTIIESGLDIPSANTIIINRADALGLAEIYQLRGRVGRSSTQSFAYLLVPSVDSLSRDSRDRLRALMDCNELGGGFKLAMSDLQIRGGGNLLGVSQSGNIAAIGYDLYLDLLQKTVADLKAKAAKGEESKNLTSLDPEINLQISAYIPATYIPDISQRYITYRRIAALVSSPPEIFEDLKDELRDRYGTIPEETASLFQIVAVKKELAQLRIHKLEKGRNTLVFHFSNDTPVSPEMLMTFLRHHSSKKRGIEPRITPEGRLIINGEMTSTEQIFATITGTINNLEKLTCAGN